MKVHKIEFLIRRAAAGVVVALVAGAAASGGGPAVAHASTGGPLHSTSDQAGIGSQSGASADAVAGDLYSMTRLRPSQVRDQRLCDTPQAGRVQCAAEALISRNGRSWVHPVLQHLHRHHRARGSDAQHAAPRTTGPTAAPQAGTPAAFQQAYDLAYLSRTRGTADTVAVAAAYDDPAAEADLSVYRAQFGLPSCTTANGCFRKVNQAGGASPLPTSDAGWTVEISLDLDAVSAVCPNCHILLVESSANTTSDLDAADETAAQLGADQISDSWSTTAATPVAGTYTFPGIPVFAASGDAGYNLPGMDAYPAALPGVTAVGGTTVGGPSGTTLNTRGYAESAWSLGSGHGGGSGCDLAEPQPADQLDTGCSGRAYSDLAADANPSSGLMIYDSLQNGWLIGGGTSLATPLVAAYDAITGLGTSISGFAYTHSALFNDVTTGSNGSCSPVIIDICAAQVGYDGPTGVGSISGDVVPGAPGLGGPSIGNGADDTFAQSVTSSGATLTAGIYPNGLATTYFWQYGPTTSYGSQTAATSVGAGQLPVSTAAALGGLLPMTDYHYRLVATNSDGTSYGFDSTLRTGVSAPILVAPPVVQGVARAGGTLTATTGVWRPGGTYLYQWQRASSQGGGWTDIAGARRSSLVVTAAPAPVRMRIEVTASDRYGHHVAFSDPVADAATAVHVRRTTQRPKGSRHSPKGRSKARTSNLLRRRSGLTD